jgi:hypothetical protein
MIFSYSMGGAIIHLSIGKNVQQRGSGDPLPRGKTVTQTGLAGSGPPRMGKERQNQSEEKRHWNAKQGDAFNSLSLPKVLSFFKKKCETAHQPLQPPSSAPSSF